MTSRAWTDRISALEEVERTLLVALLTAPESVVAAVVVEERLQAGDFISEARGAVYDAVVGLDERGGATVQLVRDELAGNPAALAALDAVTGRPATLPIAHVRAHARRILEHAQTRRLVRAGQTIVQAAESGVEGKQLLDLAVEQVDDARSADTQAARVSMAWEAVDEAIDLAHRASASQVTTGWPTGIEGYDEMTGGLHPGQLVVIAARPGMGKSALATTIARNLALAGRPTLLCSPEMSRIEVAQRLIASQAMVPLDQLRRGGLKHGETKRMLQAGQALTGRPLWIDDTADVSVGELRAKARRWHRRHGLQVVIVDYLQILRAPRDARSRTEAVGEMSRGLKVLAKELGVCVIALAQLSRALEQRSQVIQSKRPMLSDLRESGAIEQDADVVAFLFREAYYERLAGEQPTDPTGADLIVAKHRAGDTGDVPLTYLGEYTMFTGPDRGRVHP